jgi:hypothetical protein
MWKALERIGLRRKGRGAWQEEEEERSLLGDEETRSIHGSAHTVSTQEESEFEQESRFRTELSTLLGDYRNARDSNAALNKNEYALAKPSSSVFGNKWPPRR